MNKFDVFSNKFSQDVFLNKYSLDKQETWEDLSRRVTHSVCGQLLPKEDQEEIFKIIYDRKFIPGGRYLASAGRPKHQVNNCFDGNEKFITDKGSFAFKDLVGQTVNVRNWEGKWEPATVNSYGNQELVKVTFSNGETVLTTENHLWIQPDGTRVTTRNLKRAMLSVVDKFPELDVEGIRHGIIFGDGYKHPKTGYTEMVIVNPTKDEALASYFEQKDVEIIVGFGAKRIYQTIRKVKAGTKIGLQPKHYKEFPKTYTPEYARGFIAGLIATDGHASLSGSVLISCEGLEKAKTIRDIAIAGGCVVSSVRIASKINPFNNEPRELCNVYIKPFSAPIILPSHKANTQRTFYKREIYLDVVNLEKTGITKEVYCVDAPLTHTFTLSNGLLTSNCFLFRAEDTSEGWAELMYKATAALLSGGGIGVDYSALRPEGAGIKGKGGFSTGPLALMRMVNEAGRYIMQGGQRRSAIWAGLQWDHGDIFKFLELKNHSQQLKDLKASNLLFNLDMELTNVSVIYNTEFYIAFEDSKHEKHEHAKKVWNQNCLQAFSTAEPGFSFNFRKDNESLRNACVTGDTEILTDDGYVRIAEVVGKEVNVWNGFEFSKVTPKVTGNDREVVTVVLSNGQSLTCTKNHRFEIAEGYSGRSKSINAENLETGMKLIKHDYPIIEHGPTLNNAYTAGFVSADGMELNRTLYVYSPKKCCFDRLEGIKSSAWEENNNRFRVILKETPASKNLVPIEYNLKSKMDWLSGLFDGDGTELKEGGLQLASINKPFLINLQKLLTTVGVASKIVPAAAAGYRMLPDHKGGSKEFYCQECYRICIGAVQMQRLKSLGLNCTRMAFDKTPQRDASQFVTVVDVVDSGVADTVYCFNEPKRHLGTFNGVVTGQCTEVVSEDDSDKCNLGTIWINRIENTKELRKVVKYATKFLMCGGIYSDVPTEKIRQVGNKNNRIGLGLGGIHEWLMIRGESYKVTPELHKWLSIYRDESDSEAFISAKLLNVSVPKGIRAIAPTGSIGILAETTTGIESLFCAAYKRRYFKDGRWMHQYVVDGSVKRLLEKGVDVSKIQDAYSISFKDRVKFQADVQNYVDMSISSTCNLPEWGSENNNEITLKEYSKTLYKYAKRLRGFTCYPDGCRGGQPLTRVSLQEALAQEGKVFEESEVECVGGVCGI